VGIHHRILIVNSESETTELIGSFLKMHNFVIETACSAEEVMEKYRYQRFDVIIVDATLPGMPGLAFLEMATQKCPMTVKILLTDNAHYEKSLRAFKRKEVFRFFSKPFDFPALLAAIKQGIAGKELLEKSQLKKLTSRNDDTEEADVEKLAIDKTQTGSIVLSDSTTDFCKLLGDLE
jgi:DNA-binding NtrC family response regulator